MGILREDLYKFVIISHWIILGLLEVPDKICRGNHNTHFTSNSDVMFVKPDSL
jgi:hypothetical protein